MNEEIKHEPIAYSPSVNVIRPILAKHMNEWSNEMLCELANEIDLAVSKERERILERLKMKYLPIVQENTTWGDTKHNSNSVRVGYNESLDDIINLINTK